MLTPAEQQRLWLRRDAGDAVARDQIITAYLYLVPVTRKRVIPIVPHQVDIDDLDSEGMIALVKAVDRYDTAREIKFTAYAITLIRGAMQEWLRHQDVLPRSLRTAFKRLEQAEEELRADGRASSAQALADCIGVDEQQVHVWRSAIEQCQRESLDDACLESLVDARRDLTVADSIADPAPTPEQQLIARAELQVARANARQVLALLSERERFIIRQICVHGRTQSSTAVLLGISSSLISKLVISAKIKVRYLMTQFMQEE